VKARSNSPKKGTLQMQRTWYTVFANSLDAFVPEIWAAESLMVLNENLVVAQQVHRDFSASVASFGDTVNTRRPAKFVGVRKTDTDNVTEQAASAENVPVQLNMHYHVTFVIKDGEESRGMISLRDAYLAPAMQGIAQAIDESLAGQRYEFLGNIVGKLGTAPTRQTIIDAVGKLDTQLCPQMGRYAIWSPSMKGKLLGIDDFIQADKRGDGGEAMRLAEIGRVLNVDNYMSQNFRLIEAASGAVVTGAVNNASGYAAGTTSITVDGFTGALTAGSWLTIAGDNLPRLITSTTETAGNTTAVVLATGLTYAVVDNAVVTVIKPAKVNLAAGYAAGYAKNLVIDGVTVSPQIGQLVSYGTTAAAVKNYGAVTGISSPSATALTLNRPLDAALADDAVLGLGPAGDYGFMGHRNAIALVTRPLARPADGTGARSAIVDENGIGLRVVITYDGQAQGHRVTVDLLAGVKTLDTNLGVIVAG
jgi:hypothetical protein